MNTKLTNPEIFFQDVKRRQAFYFKGSVHQKLHRTYSINPDSSDGKLYNAIDLEEGLLAFVGPSEIVSLCECKGFTRV